MSLPNLLDTFVKAKAHHATSDIELELRFTIPSLDEYRSLLVNIIEKGRASAITRSINIIKQPESSTGQSCSSGAGNWIATMHYSERAKDGVAVVEKDGTFIYGCKRRIAVSKIKDDFAPYKIVVSEEAKRDKFDVSSFSRLRIKLRISVLVPELKDWRFDFTLTVELMNTNELKSKREAMFPVGMTVENFVDKAPFIEAHAYEFEVEYVGDAKEDVTSADVYKIVDFIRSSGQINYTSNVQYQQTVFDIAKLLYPASKAERYRRKLGQKAIGVNAIGLDRSKYFSDVLPNITDFSATEKADGERVIGYITGSTARVIGGDITTIELKDTHDKPTVYEAEIHDGIQYVYDVMVYRGDAVYNLNFDKRIRFREHVVKILGPIARVKTHTRLTENYANELKEIYERDYPYPIDGVVLYKLDEVYNKNVIFKWKPPKHLTLDLLVMKPPQTGVIGIAPHLTKEGYDLYFLFCGIDKRQHMRTHRIRRVVGYGTIFRGKHFYDYYPIQFAPSSNPIAYIYYHPKSDTRDFIGSICEFKRVNNMWEMTRVRTDRNIELSRGSYFGNNIIVAESTWNNIQNPLTFDMLRSPLMDVVDQMTSYFGKTDKRYQFANWYSSYVKNKSLESFSKLDWVIDLAAGRGADLGRWSRLGIKNALVIDNDTEALKELQRRQSQAQRGIGHYKTVVYSHQANLNDDWKDLSVSLKEMHPIPPNGAPLLVCNMAIHYMCESDVSISNFVMLVDSLIRDKGYFVFTCYNGRRVFELLGAKERFESFDNNVLKYSIIRAFLGSDFKNYGQKIQTLLGFTNGEHRMEWLVDISYVIKMFRGRGFKLVKHERFDSHMEEYSIDNIERYDKLSNSDFDHVGLFDYVILQKLKKLEPVSGAGSLIVETKETSFVVETSPMVVIPTKKTQASVRIGSDVLSQLDNGDVDLIVLLNTKVLSELKPGDRIRVSNTFDAVVLEARVFPTYKNVFNTYDIKRIIPDSTIEDAIDAFRGRYTYSRETRRGVIALRLRRL
jgi:ASC-1-like (ASCH) protein